MTSFRLSRIAGFLLGLLTLGAAPTSASACIALSSVDYLGPTYTESERAVIIWDGRRHIEHFLRQAGIHTGGGATAFLVPTPETPEMGDVDPAIYTLANAVGSPSLVPPVRYETPWDIFASTKVFREQTPIFGPTASAAAPATAVVHPGSGPVILEEDVAGFHATVLSTDDYPSIAAWLAKNGFATTPQVEAWIKSYGARHWKINAFKLIKAAPNDDGTLTTPPLRLSFHTDAPYYPYSEPADRRQAESASPGGRILTVDVLSDDRMSGALADKAAWPGQLLYAGPSAPDGATRAEAAKWLIYSGLDHGPYSMPLPSHLTAFVDDANPRPGTADLYFSPNADQGFFRGVKTDYHLAPVTRLDWSRPWSVLTGFVAMLLIPGAPLYCGWRTLAMIRRRRSDAAPVVESRAWRIADSLLGTIAIFVGMIGSIPSGVAAISGIASLFTGYSEGIFMMIVGIPALLICLGTVHCGHKTHLHWRSHKKMRSFRLEQKSKAIPKRSQPAAIPSRTVGNEVPVPLIHCDPSTSEITVLDGTPAPIKRYDRAMAIGSILGGIATLCTVVVIFLSSGIV